MKILQLYYPDELLALPQEDAWAIDEEHGAFAVADGVHMLPGIEYPRGRDYPSPSPAGRLAKEFCKNFVKFQKRVGVRSGFEKANRSVLRLNKKRDKASVFLKAEAYYAATASAGRITGRTLEWMGICDASITAMDSHGKIILSHTDHAHHNEFDPLLRRYFHLDRSYMFRTIFRNALSLRGEKLGYGVITGEKEAETYTWSGKRTLHAGDIAIFATDGFEEYLKQLSFRKALATMKKENVEKAMLQLKAQHEGDAEFILERTLVAVQVD